MKLFRSTNITSFLKVYYLRMSGGQIKAWLNEWCQKQKINPCFGIVPSVGRGKRKFV